MERFPIYSIGHGRRKQDVFLQLLKQSAIEFLIDVRSIPYSKFNPQFNQPALKSVLEQEGIRYVFMGDALGGRPKDLSCYNSAGKIDYERIKSKDFFLRGIGRIKTAYEKQMRIALMCSETNPCKCHRSKLIGKVLFENNIPLVHIDENGKLKDQLTLINEANKKVQEALTYSLRI